MLVQNLEVNLGSRLETIRLWNSMKEYNLIYEYPCYICHIISVSKWNEVGTFGQFVDHHEYSIMSRGCEGQSHNKFHGNDFPFSLSNIMRL